MQVFIVMTGGIPNSVYVDDPANGISAQTAAEGRAKQIAAASVDNPPEIALAQAVWIKGPIEVNTPFPV